MPSLTLKNIPEEVHRALKQRSRRNARSLNSEAIDCLRRAVMIERIDPETLLTKARQLRSGMSVFLTDKDINAMKDEGRP
jgi:plasmid stability protein